MFQLAMFPITPSVSKLLCRFPYAMHTSFKEAVPARERWWHPELRAWELSATGFCYLCDAEAERIAPLPLAVLDWVYRPPPPLEAKRRRTRRTP